MKKGDIIEFGKYPQGADGSVLPIEWIVLDVNEKEALLISRYVLDCMPYNYDKENVINWKYCFLRIWLNNNFIRSAFSEEEAKKIKVSELKNEDNPKYGTIGGGNTKDRIFCLSINEAEHYFESDNDRQCKPTAYAREQGVYVNNSNSCCFWWLRSPGYNLYQATDVDSCGTLRLYGNNVIADRSAVRPALRIIFEDELKLKQLEEQDRKQREELQAQTYKEFLAIIKKGIKKGMIIHFGSYPQNENGCRVPIEWLVLDVKKPSLINRLFYGDKIEALLISRYALDCKKYHQAFDSITWEDCDLRRWLNNNFIKSAFSEEEAKKIKVSELKNEDNHECGTKGGNDTKDRIFCLSTDEAEHYFGSDNDIQCKPTAYASKQGVEVVDNKRCVWWLRSPGGHQLNAQYVGFLGVHPYGVNIFNEYAVRPALWIICNL